MGVIIWFSSKLFHLIIDEVVLALEIYTFLLVMTSPEGIVHFNLVVVKT